MALITGAVKGTADLLPAESFKTRYVEAVLRRLAESYGFCEMRTPVFEHTELFKRGVGEATDVVQKEMYTFKDRGGRSITLRPEGTAGTVRAFLEHGLFNEPLPQKVYYLNACYRYEKPQAGRLREFWQFGVESFGAGAPAADAELISLANEIFRSLGVKALSLRLNSIGCPDCRAAYRKALRDYFEVNCDTLCETCRSRLEKNPLRILDCKSPVCAKLAEGAPKISDFLCGACREHFEKLQKYLNAAGIGFTVDARIVRGLDYYTGPVFEFVSDEIGAQGTVCGGGRYDGLIAEMGGRPMPACGFGLGIERLLLLLNAQGFAFPERKKCELFLVSAGEEANLAASRLAEGLRKREVAVQFDTMGRSVKAQMKYADRLGVLYTAVIGDDELKNGVVNLKRMSDGMQEQVELSDFTAAFLRVVTRQPIRHFGVGGSAPKGFFGGKA